MPTNEITRKVAVIAATVATGATLLVLGGVLFSSEPKPTETPSGSARVRVVAPVPADARIAFAPTRDHDDDHDDDRDDDREEDREDDEDSEHEGAERRQGRQQEGRDGDRDGEREE